MDYAISFVPNDILDMTARAAAKKVNPKITISIRIGIGPAVVGKDIHVEDISFQGTMRIKLKLMVRPCCSVPFVPCLLFLRCQNNFPHGALGFLGSTSLSWLTPCLSQSNSSTCPSSTLLSSTSCRDRSVSTCPL